MNNKKPIVLLVDDSLNTLILLTAILEDDYVVRTARSGEEALKIVLDEGCIPDLILLDVIMPNMDGYEVCKKLKENPKSKDIYIIFVSANDSMKDYSRGLNLGALDYITKPFHSSIVQIKVKNYIALKTKNDELLNMSKELKEQVENNAYKDKLLQQQSRQAAMGEMIANIAHQWRQPLGAISAAAGSLMIKSELGQDIAPDLLVKNMESISKSALYLSKTIDDFRNFLKDDQTKSNFNISKILETSISLTASGYETNYISIEKSIDKNITYFGQSGMLSQVILNILANAKDALVQANTVDKKVKISLKKTDTKIVIEIKDNAGGISDKIKEKIFDPYFTTKHKSSGTGLGLYMCNQIIRNKLHGILYALNKEDEDGIGACFTIELPILKEDLGEVNDNSKNSI